MRQKAVEAAAGVTAEALIAARKEKLHITGFWGALYDACVEVRNRGYSGKDFLGEHFGLSLEGSYQMRRIKVIDPSTDAPLTAQVGRFGIMPYFSPSGRGTFKRPQIRLIYALTGRDSGAKRLYAAEDIVGQRGVDHFLGLGAEWWFNSSSYP